MVALYVPPPPFLGEFPSSSSSFSLVLDGASAPLHSAAVYGHTLTTMDLAMYLACLGADMKETNEEGNSNTPLKFASGYRDRYGHSETFDCLQKLMKERQLKKKQLKQKKMKAEHVESQEQGIPDKSDGKPLFVGTTVEIHSLKAAGLNGQSCKLVEWDAKKQLWHAHEWPRAGGEGEQPSEGDSGP